jgi:BASS family bile acid:Na+ symporter
MRPRDLVLISVAMAGIAGGVGLPGPAGAFTPYVLYFMMAILFLSFLKIDFRALVRMGAADAAEVAAWSFIKLVALPLALWALARWLAPSFALPVLLLSGVSTGVTAPFFAGVVGANAGRVLQLTVATSLVVWLSLPALVELLMGREMDIPFWHMARMLLLVIFVPLAAALAVRRLAPGLLAWLERIQFPLSLCLFFVINLGVFSGYSAFLLAHQAQVAATVAAAFVLGGLYILCGFAAAAAAGRRLNGLTGAVGLTYVNNVLIVVFAARFFGPEAPLLAALYLLPYFLLLIPLRWLAGRLGWLEA